MRYIQGVFLLALIAGGTVAHRRAVAATGWEQTAPAVQPRAAATPQELTVQEINDRFVKQWSERIAGKQDAPAEQVFKNIQWLKGVPAGRFLSIMNGGYSRALGVTCTHCHVGEDFSSDDKRPKLAAREMAVMHRMINEQLRKMQNLQSKPAESRAINCSTCHCGAINPMAAAR
jgi:hypothetical protein